MAAELDDLVGEQLEEEAEVLAVDDAGIWVDARRRSACGACAAQQGCGQGLLERLLNRPARLRVGWPQQRPRVRVGQRVRLGIPAGAVLRASLVLYLTPLCGLLGVALLAAAAGVGQGGQAALAVLGAGLGWWLAGWLQRWLVPDVEPALLAVLPPADTAPVRLQEFG